LTTPTLTVRDPNPEEISDQLYRHSRKPQWGLAVLAWERNGRRAFQFEDGRMRKIRKGYYDLLEPVEDPEGTLEGVREGLRKRLTTARGGTSRPSALEPVCSFQQQVDLFTKLYPGGFQDTAWIKEKRGSVDGSSLKRHREPAVAAAREALDPDRAGSLLEGDGHTKVAESIFDVLADTDLVPLSHVKLLRRLEPEETSEFAEVSFALAHGEAPFEDRFRAHLEFLTSVLGGRPSWRVATALPALLHPTEEVPVRRSAFVRQAGSIAPTGTYSRKPRVPSYRSFRRMSRQVRTRLQEMGHEPADFLDVHDFIWTTLRKSALDHL
jgi:hypothetical protein